MQSNVFDRVAQLLLSASSYEKCISGICIVMVLDLYYLHFALLYMTTLDLHCDGVTLKVFGSLAGWIWQV